MKQHNITFTSNQLGSIMQACEYAINDNYSLNDPINQHYIRIIKKIQKELKASEPEKWDFSDWEEM